MQGLAPICTLCERLVEPGDDEYGFKCAAFPDGIPDEILVGTFDHRKAYPEDKGIRFQARIDVTEKDVNEFMAERI